jgi:hypothetical protein
MMRHPADSSGGEKLGSSLRAADGTRRGKCREWGLLYDGDPTPPTPLAP